MELFKAILEDRPPSGILYHYTDQNGLLGIVSSKEIWASKINYLNDSEEFNAALSLTNDRIKSMVKQNVYDDVIYAEIIESIEASIGINICVCSFSADGDLLDQWRGYCNGGAGFSIGIRYELLNDLAASKGFVIGKCLYEEPDQENLVSELVRDLVAFYKTKLPSRKNHDHKVKFRNEVRSRFSVYAPLIKNKNFLSEREWRLISRGYKEYSDERFGFRVGKSMMIPHYRFPLVMDSADNLEIEELIVGPCPNINLSVQSLKGLLVSKGCVSSNMKPDFSMSNLPNVEATRIPFRNW